MSALEIDDLFCLYRLGSGDVAALRGLTLQVERGECVLVHGPSGAGKTTLMRVVTGFLTPSAGRVRVLGAEINRLSEHDRARFRATHLGLIDQRYRSALRDELSVRDNVALQLGLLGITRSEARKRAEAQLERVGLADLSARSPVELSGGQAQRVALCAALAHEPELIFADEPTGELDEQSADAVYALLRDVTHERRSTLLIVSHDPRAAAIADRMVRIRDGRVSEERSPADGAVESLVVDRRGWVRLPEATLAAIGPARRVVATTTSDRIELRSLDKPVGASSSNEQAAVRAVGSVLVRAVSIAKAYGETYVFGPLDLTLAAGEFVVVGGRSGSGKTTLLRLLAGLERPTAGQISIAGVDLSTLNRAELAELRRAHLAVADQNVALVDSLDAIENLDLSARQRGGRKAGDILDRLALGGLAARQAAALSGGERQRLALARALTCGAQIVLVDEPTSQLDEVNAERVGGALRSAAARGLAILCATHDPTVIPFADRVIDLHESITTLHAF